MSRFRLIKWCLHLPYSQSIAAQNLQLLSSSLQLLLHTCWSSVLVFSADESLFFYSQQPSNTNRQMIEQLRTGINQKGRLKRTH